MSDLNISARSNPGGNAGVLATAILNEGGAANPATDNATSPQPGAARTLAPDTRVAVAVVDDVAVGLLCVAAAAVLVYALYQFETAVGSDGKTASQVRGEIVADAAQKIHDLFQNTVGLVSDQIPSLESLKASIGEMFRSASGGMGDIQKMSDQLVKRVFGGSDAGSAVQPAPSTTVTTGTPTPAVGTTPQTRTQPTVRTVPRTTTSTTTPSTTTNTPSASAARAALDAVSTLTQANSSRQTANAAVADFYQQASGGLAARQGGRLDNALQTARTANQQLSSQINQATRQIAASPAAQRPALTAQRDELVRARDETAAWLRNATAFAQGQDQPNGKHVAAPRLPAPPATAGATAQNNYEAARTALQTSAANTSAAAAQKQSANDQAAADVLARANPVTQRLNTAVNDFYQQASGGKAARVQGALSAPLAEITAARKELNQIITASNSMVAASRENHAELNAWRNNLVQTRKAIDVWLKDANAFAAGLDKPAGKPSANPPLPAVPSFVSSPAASGLSAAQVRASMQANLDRARAATTTTAPAAAPQIELVTQMPAQVKSTASVWVNSRTGAVSAQARQGADWQHATLGSTTLAMSNNGVQRNWGQGNSFNNTNNFYMQPDQDPDPKKKINWTAVSIAVGTLISGGGLAFSAYQQGRSEQAAREDRTEAAWQPAVALEPMPVQGAVPAGDAQCAQIVATWQHFLAQAPAVLRSNGVDAQGVAAFEKARDNFITKQLLPVQQQLQNTPDPAAKNRLLQAMANLKLPALSVATNAADPKAGRTTKTLVVLTQALTDGVNNAVSLILNSAAAKAPPAPPKRPQDNPSVKPAKPATPATSATPADAAAERARLQALLDRATPKALPAAPPATPVAPVVLPAPVTTAAAEPKARPQPTPRVTAKAPAAAAAVPTDAKPALAKLQTIVTDAALNNPPSTTQLAQIKFSREMFIAPEQQQDAAAVLDAIGRARKMFDAIGEVWKTSSPATKEAINGGPWASINAVLRGLTDTYNGLQPPAAPAAQPATP